MNTNAKPTEDESTWANLEGWERTLAQMMEMFIKPEIKRRADAGILPEPFFLWAAQALWPEEGPTQVLLNDEVKGEGVLRAPRPIDKGEPVLSSDFDHLEAYDLPDELLDHGHFTIFRAGDRWGMFFNALSGRAKARDTLELAAQFLVASKDAATKGHDGPAVEAMFSACELVSKAELMLHRMSAARSKTHKSIHSSINQWAKLGNIDAAFVALFNSISGQRPNARYGDAQSRPPSPSDDDFSLVETMIGRGLEQTAKATDQRMAQEHRE